MLEGELRRDLDVLNLDPGGTLVCLAPRSYVYTLANEDQSVEISIDVPTKYPKISPVYSIKSATNMTDEQLDLIHETINEVTRYLTNEPNIITILFRELRSVLWSPKETKSGDIHFPDSIETSRLLVENSLNITASDQWMKDRAVLLSPPEKIKQSEMTCNSILIYCLYKLCGGKFTLEDCANILINQLQIIAPPGPPIDSISASIAKIRDSSQALPPYLSALLFQAANIPSSSQITSFFTDFDIISVCAPMTVRARNRVDRRDYAVKAVVVDLHLKQLPRNIVLLTQLQHRYIVRYYNSWIDDCDEQVSKAVSESFGFSNVIIRPTSFMFIQMDYCNGNSLADKIKDRTFFDSSLQWTITQQILESLHYLHSHDIVHNNLIPDNIFIEGDHVKLGDFSNQSTLPSFPYCDPRKVIDYKSDMFSFAILFFEMWYPFSCPEERDAILTSLINDGEIPQSWSVIFPLQTKIVKLLLQPAPKRPSALDFIQAKIIPTIDSDAAELKTLTMGISSGTIKLDSHAPEVLNALFSEPRRLPFRLEDFIGKHNTQGAKGRFSAFVISEFFNIATKFGGQFFTSPIISTLTADEPNVTMMSKDGTLHGLRTTVTRFFVRWVNENGFKSLRLFSKHNVFREPNNNTLLKEGEMLSFDIVSMTQSIADYMIAFEFATEFIISIFPEINLTNATDKIIRIETIHIGLIKGLAELEKRGLVKLNKKVLSFKELMKIKDRKKNDSQAFQQAFNEIDSLRTFYMKVLGNVECVFEIVPQSHHLNQGNIVRILYKGAEIAFIARAPHYIRSADAPSIMSCRITMRTIMLLYEMTKSYTPKQSEVLFIIVNKAIPVEGDVNREKFTAKDWNYQFAQLQPIASALRGEKIAVTFSSNDGRPVQHYLDLASELCISTPTLVFVNERGRVFVRFESSKLDEPGSRAREALVAQKRVALVK